MTAPADRPAALTEAALVALEALVTAAPVGPWSCADELNKHDYVAITQTAGDWGDIADAYDLDAARFICASREAVPALIAQVRRLRDALVPLVAEAPTYATEVGHVYCAYCHRRLTPDGFQFPDRRPYPPGHESDCPWLAARVALTRPVPAP